MKPLIDDVSDHDVLPGEPFVLRHNLATHALFDEHSIRKLLQTVPRNRIEVSPVPVVQKDPNAKPLRAPKDSDKDPLKAYEELEDEHFWIVVHDSSLHDKAWKDLLTDYLSEMGEYQRELRGYSKPESWILISSPGSVIHFHSDPDEGFLNQIRGTKEVIVYPASIIDPVLIERLVRTEDQRLVSYAESYEKQAFESMTLEPGMGAYLPHCAPHRVINNNEVCIAFTVGFFTQRSYRLNQAMMFNHALRSIGLSPRPVGRQTQLDLLKYYGNFGVRAGRKAARLMGVNT